MKNTWWLIYNDFSIFTEYFDIVDFIFKTFNEENIVCLKVPISSLKKDFDTYLSKTLFVPDCVLFWDKNWEIAKKFADLGIIVYNQPSQSILCENKIETYKYLQGSEVIPNTIIMDAEKAMLSLNTIVNEIKFPIVAKLKESVLGSNVFILKDKNMLINFLIGIKSYEDVAFQEYLYFSPNKEIKVFCTQTQILSSYRRVSKKNGGYSYKSYELNCLDKHKIKCCCDILKLDFFGIDMMYKDKKKLLISDVNTQPNVLNIYKILKINVIAKILNDYN